MCALLLCREPPPAALRKLYGGQPLAISYEACIFEREHGADLHVVKLAQVVGAAVKPGAVQLDDRPSGDRAAGWQRARMELRTTTRRIADS